MTIQLVQTITVGAGGASSIEFTAIPSNADDIYLVLSGRSTNADSSISLRVNGSASNLYMLRLTGYGSSVDSGTSTSQIGNISGSDYTSNTFGNTDLRVFKYASSDTYKTFSSNGVSENNATLAVQNAYAGRWLSTSAITSIGFWGNFAQHSTASLYTITKA